METKQFTINNFKDWLAYKDDSDGYIHGLNTQLGTSGVKHPFMVIFHDLKKWEEKEEKLKSGRQIRTFWSLLNCYWSSGVSSYNSYEEMVDHFYELGGLIEYTEKNTLLKETKYMLYESIKIIPILEDEKEKIYRMLRGVKEKQKSLTTISKEKMTFVISSIIDEMDESCVIGSKMGKKYSEILEGMDKRGELRRKISVVRKKRTTQKPNSIEFEVFKKAGYKDPKYLEHIRNQPCVICRGRNTIMRTEPHHWQTRNNHGLGGKASDACTMSLCFTHHNEIHGKGREYSAKSNLEFLRRYFPKMVKTFHEEEAELDMANILLNNYRGWKDENSRA